MTLRYTSPPSQRQLQVGELIRAEVSNLFIRGILMQYNLEGIIVSVSEVRISRDLKIATIFLVPAMEGDREKLSKILIPLAAELRRSISPKLHLKFSPQMRIVFDEAADYADHIEKILHELKDAK